MSYEKKVVETAMLAGELMLVSGAEIYRVEDTMSHILDIAKPATHTVFALSTGINLTLLGDEEVITMTKRVNDRSTNLNKIYLVNNISRELTSGKLDINKAYSMLKNIENERLYTTYLRFMAFVLVAAFFTMLLGGNIIDCIAAGIVGIVLGSVNILSGKIGFNGFLINFLSSFSLVISSVILKEYFIDAMGLEIVIIGAIMPLVPGVIFTTAMRDTLNGDYASGMGRILEAIVIAMAVASGAGAAMALMGGVL